MVSIVEWTVELSAATVNGAGCFACALLVPLFQGFKSRMFLAFKEEEIGLELDQLTKKLSEDPCASRKRTSACAAVVPVMLEM